MNLSAKEQKLSTLSESRGDGDFMINDIRDWGIILTVGTISHLDGSLVVNFEATSLSGGPQIHCDFRGMPWESAKTTLRALSLCKPADIQEIEGILRNGHMGSAEARCKESDFKEVFVSCS